MFLSNLYHQKCNDVEQTLHGVVKVWTSFQIVNGLSYLEFFLEKLAKLDWI